MQEKLTPVTIDLLQQKIHDFNYTVLTSFQYYKALINVSRYLTDNSLVSVLQRCSSLWKCVV